MRGQQKKTSSKQRVMIHDTCRTHLTSGTCLSCMYIEDHTYNCSMVVTCGGFKFKLYWQSSKQSRTTDCHIDNFFDCSSWQLSVNIWFQDLTLIKNLVRKIISNSWAEIAGSAYFFLFRVWSSVSRVEQTLGICTNVWSGVSLRSKERLTVKKASKEGQCCSERVRLVWRKCVFCKYIYICEGRSWGGEHMYTYMFVHVFSSYMK